MNRFMTPVEVPVLPWQTGYRQKNLFMGSCFTENIGELMASLAFDVNVNPFGIIYNPVSISKAILRLIDGSPFVKDDLFEHNGLWHSYMHHGRFSGDSADEVLKSINSRLETGSQYIRNAGFLFVTLGSAWIYEHKATGEVVANCHKVPSREFRRFRLSLGETVESLRSALDKLWEINSGIKVIFTVSPVRHTSDGAIENQLSKSVLLLAADALVKGYGPERCAYFPSYELVMDELRDYRFYAGDMVHISSEATQYIWEKFAEVSVDRESTDIMAGVVAINKAVEHRPFNRVTKEHLSFLEKTRSKLLTISTNYPYISLTGPNQFLDREISLVSEALARR
jgi:hypothetical protein